MTWLYEASVEERQRKDASLRKRAKTLGSTEAVFDNTAKLGHGEVKTIVFLCHWSSVSEPGMISRAICDVAEDD